MDIPSAHYYFLCFSIYFLSFLSCLLLISELLSKESSHDFETKSFFYENVHSAYSMFDFDFTIFEEHFYNLSVKAGLCCIW